MGVSEPVVGQRPDGHATDDRALVVAVQGGDVAAYEELFRRHHTSVKRVCARRLGNQVEADEAAQATFVRALERIDRCIGDRRFGAWVQVIAQRLCVDMVRARMRTTPDDDPLRNERSALHVGSDLDAGAATEEALVRRERTERVHEALALLPDRQRAVVVARHLEGRRPPEIAASLGLSVGAVDSLLLRGRRRLALSYEHVLAEGGRATAPANTVIDLRSGATAMLPPDPPPRPSPVPVPAVSAALDLPA